MSEFIRDIATVALVANLVGSVSMEFDNGTTSYQGPLATLRTAIFAGGTGYTATDPLVAGTTQLGALTASAGVTFQGVNLGNAAVTTYSGSLTGATTLYANLTGPSIAADVTSAVILQGTTANLAAAMTLSQVYHFRATNASLGAGATLSQQYAYYVGSTFNSGGVNYFMYNASTAPSLLAGLLTLQAGLTVSTGTSALQAITGTTLVLSSTASATSFTGALVGNASTATTLATARNIDGVSFNGSAAINTPRVRSISIDYPGAAEKKIIFFTKTAITVSQIEAVLFGSATPSVTFSIRFGTDVSAAGTEVVTGGSTVTSVTTGSAITALNSANIPADNFVWITTTAMSGTVTALHATIAHAVT